MNYDYLNNVFSKKTFLSLLNGDNKYFNECIDYAKINVKDLSEAYESFYDILSKKYKNEYYYKNKLLTSLIISKNKLKTTKVITEFCINESVADFMTINGDIVIYEIKTEFDNLNRIKNQISDYYKITPFVNVVVSNNHLKEICCLFSDSCVGIYTLSKRGALKQIKKCSCNTNELDNDSMFDILRKEEYEKIISSNNDNLPDCGDFSYYSECKKIFRKYDSLHLYKTIVPILKKRINVNDDLIQRSPKSTRLLVYTLSPKSHNVYKLFVNM